MTRPLAPSQGGKAWLTALGLVLGGVAVMAIVGAMARLELPGPVAGSIALSAGGGGAAGIRLFGPDGTMTADLSWTGAASYPVWSPDGTRIAYIEQGFGPVHIVNADGTGARSITDGIAHGPVAWSPDGRHLAFVGSHERLGNALYVANTDGTGVVQLNGPDGALGRVAWAPDGSLIAVVASADTGAAILHVVDPRSGVVTRVSEAPLVTDSAAPSWSADGSRLLFAVGQLGRPGIAMAERGASGWADRMVATSPNGRETSPLWLDADRFVFVDSVGPGIGPSAMPRILVANADGSGRRELVRFNDRDAVPCVAPDGSRVAFVDTVGDTELLIVPVDVAAAPRRIAITGAEGPCSWRPVTR